MISVQNPQRHPSTYWLVKNGFRSWIVIIPNILGCISPYSSQPKRDLNTAHLPSNGLHLMGHDLQKVDFPYLCLWRVTYMIFHIVLKKGAVYRKRILLVIGVECQLSELQRSLGNTLPKTFVGPSQLLPYKVVPPSDVSWFPKP